MKILIATGNAGKFREMMEVLGDLPAEFVSLADLNMTNTVEETGSTFVENALLKAQYFFEKTGLPTIAEDSGLEVSALKGELGIKTRRWGAGENATDTEWLDFFLREMENKPDRSAALFCTAVFLNEGKTEIFSGETRGILKKSPQCPLPHGIPVSAIFVPEGASQVFAAMTPHEKNAISHRGKAMKALKNFLQESIEQDQMN